MPTTIAHTAVETVSRLIRNEFDRLTDIDIMLGKGRELINTARSYQLEELAEEMESDLN